jgi:hypothetical protein
LASRLAQETQQKELALEFLSLLINQTGSSDHQLDALLQRAALEEEKYQFDLALQDELLYLQKKDDKPSLKPIYLRTYLLSWLTHQGLKLPIPKELQKDLLEDFERVEAFRLFHQPPEAQEEKFDFKEKALHGIKANRPIWALITLQKDLHLSFHEIQTLLRSIASSWEQLEPIAQFDTLSTLQELLPKMIQRSRILMKKLSPLRATSKSIEHRIQFMNEIEKTSSKILKLPWARIKTEVLAEASSMYQEFSHDLSQLPIPKDLNETEKGEYLKSVQELVVPFTEKSKKLQIQAFEIATEFTVQKEIVQRLAPPSEPPQSKQLGIQSNSASLSLEFWQELNPRVKDPQAQMIQERWATAIKQKNFTQIAFFIQELKSKTSVPALQLKFMRVISLAAAGAQAEALSELESIEGDFNPKENLKINQVLYQFYLESRSEKKAQSKFEKIQGAKS